MKPIDEAAVAALEQAIAQLPKGSVSAKNIRGKVYYYHRWYENKKYKEKYVPAAEVGALRQAIASRRELEEQVKAWKKQNGQALSRQKAALQFITNVLCGEQLRDFAASVKAYKKRDCYRQLQNFIYGDSADKVFILYGLRRTGKTTMIRQIFYDMSVDMLRQTAFIQIMARNTLADVNADLKKLGAAGYKYIFLDEVTLMKDFIEGAALFSDIFAACGMKIVLSGTDSLGFLFTEDEQLYDRCLMLHTTFIPYREFAEVLGIKGIDEYIRYGGTMSLSGVNYNETSPFANAAKADEYVDTAIARNIQHSLRCYQYEGHFRHLQDLYERNELTSAINRVVEDINHRFTLEVLTRDFYSHDLAVAANNLRKDAQNSSDILDRIDVAAVTARLRRLLEIKNQDEQSVRLDAGHLWEIEEYLQLLDLVRQIEVASLPMSDRQGKRTVLVQPGLRYAQADALVRSLLLDKEFAYLALDDRNAVLQRILNEIKGRMLEDIVLLETKLARPKQQVFVLQFPIGEFDMVVFDPEAGRCKIYEIKHSREAVPQQYRHLVNKEKCAAAEHRYGRIAGRYVLYRGPSQRAGEVEYVNVEEYLCSL